MENDSFGSLPEMFISEYSMYLLTVKILNAYVVLNYNYSNFLSLFTAGMHYLHAEAPVKVIHRDLKSRNGILANSHEFVPDCFEVIHLEIYDSVTTMNSLAQLIGKLCTVVTVTECDYR